MKTVAILLSGGEGSRMGLNIPKQYVKVENEPIINYVLRTFDNNDKIDWIVIVVANQWKSFVEEQIRLLNIKKRICFAEPGETRQYSVLNGMKVIEQNGYDKDDLVIIHEAARPLCSHELINRCIDACAEVDGIMPVIPTKDTTYYSEDGETIKSLLNRGHLWCGQAPEVFKFDRYMNIHNRLSREEILKVSGSTEIAYKNGLLCKMVAGDTMNFKITTPEDLSNFESIIKSKGK